MAEAVDARTLIFRALIEIEEARKKANARSGKFKGKSIWNTPKNQSYLIWAYLEKEGLLASCEKDWISFPPFPAQTYLEHQCGLSTGHPGRHVCHMKHKGHSKTCRSWSPNKSPWTRSETMPNGSEL